MTVGLPGFALQSAWKIITGQDKACPFCSSGQTLLLARKHGIVQLRRCSDCVLMFRWPKDAAADRALFYQRAYRDRSITELPDAAMLASLKANNFCGSSWDYLERIKIVKELRPLGRLLDYGASWGYDVDQFRSAGYKAEGFEISAPRADYGRTHLGVRVESDSAAFASQSFDVIHTSHVLEHIPDLKGPFADFNRLLAPSGVLVIFVPNAGGKSAREQGIKWEPMIGEKHVLALTAEFFARNLPRFGFSLTFASAPYRVPPRALDAAPDLEGGELLVVGHRS